MIILFWGVMISLLMIATAFILFPFVIAKDQTGLFSNNKIIIGVSVLLPIIALSIYWQSGSYQQWYAEYTLQREMYTVLQLRKELGTPQQVITALKQRLDQNPQSARGWYLLGRLYFSQSDFTSATEAFARANDLQANDPMILLQYAEALYLQQNSLQGKPKKIVQQLLRLQPTNVGAINLLAVAAFSQKHYQKAIDYWEQLLPHYAAGSPEQKALLTAIARAQVALRN